MSYSALVRLFVAILRKLAFTSPLSPRLNPLTHWKRLWALFLSTAQRLFRFMSKPGTDGLSPSRALSSIKVDTLQSPQAPILNPPIVPDDPLDEKHSSSSLLTASSPYFASAVPEQRELDDLDQVERGEAAYASVTALAEMPFADGNSSEQPVESPPQAATGSGDRVDKLGAWEMVPKLPTWFGSFHKYVWI